MIVPVEELELVHESDITCCTVLMQAAMLYFQVEIKA